MSKLIFLALGAFVVGTEAFVVAGLLPQIADDLGTTIPIAGQLVTFFALAYALGSPLMAVATGHAERKRLLLVSLACFALGNLIAAFAQSYSALLVVRLLLALAAGTYTPAASAYAALSVEPAKRGRALALVYSGMTLATVIGMPLGTSIGQNLGWRASFLAVAIMAVLAICGVALALPRLVAPPPVSLRERLAVAARRDVLAILALTALALSGAFSIFTYIAPFLHDAAGFDNAILPVLLFAFGLAGAIGNFIGGYAADHWDLRAYVAALFAILALAFIALSMVVSQPIGPFTKPLVILGIAVWGVAGWGMPAAQQARLVERDPRHAAVLISLNASALYLGSAVGAALGSLTIAYLSITKLGFIAAVMEGLGLAVLVATASVTRRRGLRVVRSSE
jgi:predicted MFS family arabinose efflux permease